MNPDEFWEKFYDKLYVNNGRVNVRLKTGKILSNISDADDYSENVYNISDFDDYLENVNKVFLYPERFDIETHKFYIVSYDEIEDVS